MKRETILFIRGVMAILGVLMAGGVELSAKSAEEERMDQLLGSPSTPEKPAAPAKSSEEQQLDKLLGTTPDATSGSEKTSGSPSGIEAGKSESADHIGFEEAWNKAKWTYSATSYGFVSDNPSARPGDDPKYWFNYTRLTMDTWLPVNNDFDIKIDLVLQYGTEEHQYNLEHPFRLDTDARSRYADFNQLYIKKKVDDFDLVFGKQRLDVAVNTLYSPCNRISPVDGNHPFDPQTLGVPQVACTYYAKQSTTEFHFMPFYQEYKPPPATSRWAASDPANAVNAAAGGTLANQFDNNQFPGVNLQGYSVPAGYSSATDAPVSARPDLPNFLVREKYIAGSIDWYGSAYYGFLPDYALPVDGIFVRNSHVRGWLPGLAAATTVGKFELHGETIVNVPESRAADTYANPCLGMEYDLNNLMGFEEINSSKFALEYAYEWVLEEQNNPQYPIRPDQIRPGRNTLFAGWKTEIENKHQPYYALIYNIRSNDYSQRVGYEYKYGDGLSFELFYQWFDGPFDTLFGQGRCNNSFVAQCVKKF